MNFDAQQVIQAELQSGERILWADQPLKGIQFRGSDAFSVPIGLIIGTSIIYQSFSSKYNNIFEVLFFNIPITLFIVYFVIGRFFADILIRKNTFYGLSDQRVIIVSHLFRKKVKSINLKTLTEMDVSETSTGKGTITFRKPPPFSSLLKNIPWPGMEDYYGPKFDCLENAKAVYNQIRDAQNKID